MQYIKNVQIDYKYEAYKTHSFILNNLENKTNLS